MHLSNEPKLRNNAGQRSSYARYLVVLGCGDTPRGVVFNAEGGLIAEMIEAESYVIEGLARSGKACPMPFASMMNQLSEVDRSPPAALRCYALGEFTVKSKPRAVTAQPMA
jgi:hypothetical protein